jgi:hypothetical protein
MRLEYRAMTSEKVACEDGGRCTIPGTPGAEAARAEF